MKKLILFGVIALALVSTITSCSKEGDFKTTVTASRENVAFSLNPALPYRLTVQANGSDENNQFVFSANTKKIYFVFADAMVRESTVEITVDKGEIVSAKKQ